MNQQTIARLYDDYTDAEATIRDLEVHGIAHDDISLIANNADDRHVVHTESGNESGTGAEIGAGLGAVAGGGAGVLAGLGMLAIPGVGPVVAAGWLVALAVGAVGGAIAGGMVGGLVGAGINKEHAETYAEGVRRGGNLVTVRVPAEHAASVEAIMDGHGAVDPATRRTEYASEGWTGYDPDAPIYSPSDVRHTPPVLDR
jgi:hypothetical protein